jgi:hypothetical protein
MLGGFLVLALFRPLLRIPRLTSPLSIRISNTHFSRILETPIFLTQIANDRIISREETFMLTDSHISGCDGFQGGGVFCQCITLHIARTQFRSNTAHFGACVFSSNVSSGLITNCAFADSSARSLCAGLFLDSADDDFNVTTLTALNHTGSVSVSVGGVECWGGLQRFSFCRIDRCRSTFSHGAVRISSVGHPSVIADARFTNNTSRQKGAAITLIVLYTLLRVERCFFMDNAQGGGSGTTLYADAGECNVTMTDCVIYGDEARQFNRRKKDSFIALRNVTFVYDPERDFMKDLPWQTRTPDCKTCPDD